MIMIWQFIPYMALIGTINVWNHYVLQIKDEQVGLAAMNVLLLVLLWAYFCF